MEQIINTTNVDANKIVFKSDKPAEPASKPTSSSNPAIETKGADGQQGASGTQGDSGTPAPNRTNSPGGQPNSSATETVVDDPAPIDLTEDQLIEVLNENTGFKFRGISEIKSVYEENKRLRTELENKELSFPTPQAKAVYDFAVRFAGGELTAAQNYLQTLSIDVDKLDPKGLQFEAFLLSKPNLDRERGKAIFNAKYEKLYGEGFEQDPLLSYEHEEATREAREAIIKAKESYPKQAASSKPGEEVVDPQHMEAVTTGINKVLEEFDGIDIAFEDSKEGTLNFNLQQDQVAGFKEKLLNPQSFFVELLNDCAGEDGQIDYGKYASEMYEILHRKQIISEARKNGFERGKLSQLQELKNSQRAGDGLSGSSAPPAKGSFVDAFADAVQASRKK